MTSNPGDVPSPSISEIKKLTSQVHALKELLEVTETSFLDGARLFENANARLKDLNGNLQNEVLERKKTNEDLHAANTRLEKLMQNEERSRLSLLSILEDEKISKNKLHDSEEKYSTIFRTSLYAITITRPQDGRFVEVNDAFLALSGFTREEAIADSSVNLNLWVEPEDRESVVAALLAGNRVENKEFRFRKRSGEFLTALFSAQIIHLSGEPVILSSINDITERKEAEAKQKNLEEQLRAAEKLDSIGSLAGGIAHDFNNLLSVILSYTGFLLKGIPAEDPLREDLLEVKKAADRAAALTRQLLAYSRKQVLQAARLDLNLIVRGTEKMLRRIIGEDIELVLVLEPDLGSVLADPGQIEQVLMNLTVNARDAMPGGGKLSIETSNADVDAEYASRHASMQPGAYVMFAVSDSGSGMDEQTQKRIFEPFFTTKSLGKGTGLGLSTVYGIIKQSNGFIWVYSEPGMGSTFKVYLPRIKAPFADSAEKPREAGKRPRGAEIVLLAEDEESMRIAMKRMLEEAGYRVLTAADGEEALEVSNQNSGEIHLLLTDVVMPKMGGRKLKEALLKVRPGLKVIYMSGYTDDAIVRNGVIEEGEYFLGKPFTEAALLGKIQEVLAGKAVDRADGLEQASKTDAVNKDRPIDKAAFMALPLDLLARLRTAVIAARYNEIMEIINTIRAVDSELAIDLKKRVELYDYDGLVGLLEPKSRVE